MGNANTIHTDNLMHVHSAQNQCYKQNTLYRIKISDTLHINNYNKL